MSYPIVELTRLMIVWWGRSQVLDIWDKRIVVECITMWLSFICGLIIMAWRWKGK